MRKLWFMLFSVVLNWSVHACDDQSTKSYLANLTWLSEDYPPFNYQDENSFATGVFTDVLMKVYQTLEIELLPENITIVPWARLYHTLEHNAEFAAYSMTYTPERAKKFLLVPLATETKVSVMVLSKDQEKFAKQALSSLKVAVVREDIAQQLLSKQSPATQQFLTTSAHSMLGMLIHERVDAIAYEQEVAFYQYQKLGGEREAITPIYTLDNSASKNFVFHRYTSKCVTELFDKTLKKLHQSGQFDEIYRRYLH